MSTRPICACCGKPYGHRVTTVETIKYPIDGKPPEYRGNGIVVKEEAFGTTASRATLAGLMMVTDRNRSDVEATLAAAPAVGYRTLRRTTWNGQDWAGGYEPFCTLRCAWAYAKAAHARLQKK